MGAERSIVLIDTNVFVIDLRYKQDIHYRANRKFLEAIGKAGAGFTTIVNLLELCGVLSLNLNGRHSSLPEDPGYLRVDKEEAVLWRFLYPRRRAKTNAHAVRDDNLGQSAFQRKIQRYHLYPHRIPAKPIVACFLFLFPEPEHDFEAFICRLTARME